MKLRGVLGSIEGILLVVGVTLMATWLLHERESLGFQQSAATAFDAASRSEPVAASRPTTDRSNDARSPARSSRDSHPRRTHESHVASGSPSSPSTAPPVIGRLEIPRLHISAMVAEGMDPGVLALAVGHVPSTPLPGRGGNCALAGHRDSFLRGLGAVRRNDLVRFTTLDGTHTYRVAWGDIVDPSRTDVLAATRTQSLTLVTCYPFDMVGRAPERFVVRAVETAADPGLR